MRVQKKINDHETALSLRELIRMGKATVTKEHSLDGPIYRAYSVSGTFIGIVGPKYKYLFESALLEHGAGDGLFEGQSQSTGLRAI